MNMILSAQNVSKAYGSYQALRDVSLNVGDTEFVSIVGPNGAGKTTLVNVLTGLSKPTSGSVHFSGRSIAGIGPVRLAALGMARSFQLVNVFPSLSVWESIAVAVSSRLGKARNPFATLFKSRQIDDEVQRVAATFGLSQKLTTKTGELSQGEKKLLDIASAFALRPRAILMDEPTSGVASADKYDIMELLVKAARLQGVGTIIQVEHDMTLVARYSHRIVALQEGRVIGDMTPDAFFKDPLMLEAVIGPAHSKQAQSAGETLLC
ncbi:MULTISPECIES: ABC transporter ATP-binding protein [Burkholderiaceae]|jgi:branched-chain amino acid transport system ATP-binding protein|uniref:ATP-binding cassette domain-containing protein n=1 Tax=Ralstonia pickettii TaxID=329 RepID=A0AAW4QBX6_RALPI|nr:MULTISPECIES: ATP-binding cassette domain-containing protein [Burkholderiaceae]AOY97646.1 ABC transporter ATP-binding protein [Cupriavidus sp. USMAA2-4]MBA9848700.1 ATP-binding cassette domain-containing protein [Ralstonia pickettii]MBA9854127.1 ATP-binding cassette domain-containing protein [Ralstonia pickettii]MBA9921745.1 ATP-binding cassette domain-containing protein [Ralstonia pickettii]MBA9960849.1 ATP-binding cassette domain-containing protein [Ralstonia pickettii]